MCTLVATDARAIGDLPPVYVYIVGEVCLGIYTLELVAGGWADGLQHFKKTAILFDLFTVRVSSKGQSSYVQNPRRL